MPVRNFMAKNGPSQYNKLARNDLEMLLSEQFPYCKLFRVWE